MNYIPGTKNAPVIRTDFSNDAAWDAICAAILEPTSGFLTYMGQGFRASVDFISDRAFQGLTGEQLLARIPQSYAHTFIFIVDVFAVARAEHPILVMDLFTERGRTFRVIPSEMWAVENNLSIANMDFAEFADAADPDGIFRGFPQS